MGDQIMGTCVSHLMISPSGAPMPAPPQPFSSPITQGLTTKVMVGGKPAAVVGSSGYNNPPHVGLHATDPFMAPPTQVGRVVAGSAKVFFEGKPAAMTGCQVLMCVAPGILSGSIMTVVIGG
jgi:uncharacterized Zn-binding protein involved in type VI secretion